MRRALILIAAGLVLSACAATEASAPGQALDEGRSPRACFTPREVRNFRTVESRTVYLRTNQDEVFEVSASGCFDLDRGYSLLITPTAGISDRLCVGDSARITVPETTIGPRQCQARVLRSLSPAEIEALPSRDRP